MPHIYTSDEIRRLLNAAAQLTPQRSIRPIVYVTLFALLVSTGIRICEALALKLEDITCDGLNIKHTKFRKSRLVPLHATVRAGLQRYVSLRRQVGEDRSLFVSIRHTGLAYSTVVSVFLELTRSINLRGGPGKPGPCIHDLRHTFAVRALEACLGGKKEIARHVLALSTYLGHTHPADTYYYLHATPKLLEGISREAETRFQGGST